MNEDEGRLYRSVTALLELILRNQQLLGEITVKTENLPKKAVESISFDYGDGAVKGTLVKVANEKYDEEKWRLARGTGWQDMYDRYFYYLVSLEGVADCGGVRAESFGIKVPAKFYTTLWTREALSGIIVQQDAAETAEALFKKLYREEKERDFFN